MLKKMTENVMVNACINFAKNAGVDVSESQLMIFTKDNEAVPAYKSLIRGKEPREVSFNEILNTKVDLLNREALSTPTIQQCLKVFAKEMEATPQDVKIVIYTDKKKAGLALYNKGKMIRPLSLDEIFVE